VLFLDRGEDWRMMDEPVVRCGQFIIASPLVRTPFAVDLSQTPSLISVLAGNLRRHDA